MLRTLCLVSLLVTAAPVRAANDELDPVPTHAVIGHGYGGETAPARIRFINVRDRPVKIMWITFDGGERPYATLEEGQEVLQPTYVAHRWLVRDAGDGEPIAAFIVTRSDRHSDGAAQIAIIR